MIGASRGSTLSNRRRDRDACPLKQGVFAVAMEFFPFLNDLIGLLASLYPESDRARGVVRRANLRPERINLGEIVFRDSEKRANSVAAIRLLHDSQPYVERRARERLTIAIRRGGRSNNCSWMRVRICGRKGRLTTLKPRTKTTQE